MKSFLVALILIVHSQLALAEEKATPDVYIEEKRELTGEELIKKQQEDKEKAEEVEERRRESALKNLSSDNPEPLEKAMYFFEMRGEETVPLLMDELRRRGGSLQSKMNIMYTLGRVGPKARRAVPTIIPFLKHKESDARAVAALTLKKIGPDAKDAVSYLGTMIHDEDRWARESAVEALKAIGSEDAEKILATIEQKKQEEKERKQYFSR